MKAICALAVLSCLVLFVLSSCNADIVVFLFGTENDQAAADLQLVQSTLEFPILSSEDPAALDFAKGLDSAELYLCENWDLNVVAMDCLAARVQETEASVEALAASGMDSFSSLDSIELELWSIETHAEAMESPDFQLRKAKRIVELKR